MQASAVTSLPWSLWYLRKYELLVQVAAGFGSLVGEFVLLDDASEAG